MITTDKLLQPVPVQGIDIIDPTKDGTASIVRYLDCKPPKTLTVKELMDGLEMIDRKQKQLAEAKANMEELINKALKTA
jgi:hypothetical protein